MIDVQRRPAESSKAVIVFATVYFGWILSYPIHLIAIFVFNSTASLVALLPFLLSGTAIPELTMRGLVLEALRFVGFAALFLHLHKKWKVQQTWLFALKFVLLVWLSTLAVLLLFGVPLGKMSM
jgi:hypothetical protein